MSVAFYLGYVEPATAKQISQFSQLSTQWEDQTVVQDGYVSLAVYKVLEERRQLIEKVRPLVGRVLAREQALEKLPRLIRWICQIFARIFTNWRKVRTDCEKIREQKPDVWSIGRGSLKEKYFLTSYSEDPLHMRLRIEQDSDVWGHIDIGNDWTCLQVSLDLKQGLEHLKGLSIVATLVAYLKRQGIESLSILDPQKQLSLEQVGFGQSLIKGYTLAAKNLDKKAILQGQTHISWNEYIDGLSCKPQVALLFE